MKTNYTITKENYYADIAKMANLIAIDVANAVVEGYKVRKGTEDPFSDIRLGCTVPMKECQYCAHTGKCHLQQMRTMVGNAIEAATTQVVMFFEDNTKWEGGDQ